MDDKTSFTMKSMLLRTTKTTRLQRCGGIGNDSWRVPVGFLTPFKWKGVKKSTKDTQQYLWVAPVGHNHPNRCGFG